MWMFGNRTNDNSFRFSVTLTQTTTKRQKSQIFHWYPILWYGIIRCALTWEKKSCQRERWVKTRTTKTKRGGHEWAHHLFLLQIGLDINRVRLRRTFLFYWFGQQKHNDDKKVLYHLFGLRWVSFTSHRSIFDCSTPRFARPFLCIKGCCYYQYSNTTICRKYEWHGT